MAQTVLGAVTNFSFLRGASHPHEMVETAASMGWKAIGISDEGTMAAMVRAHLAAQQADIKLLYGSSLTLIEGLEVILYARNRAGYGSICQLLSQLNMSYQRSPAEGASTAAKARIGDLARLCDNVITIIKPPSQPQCDLISSHEKLDDPLIQQYQKLKTIIEGPLYAGGYIMRDGFDEARLAYMSSLAQQAELPFVALCAALYHIQERRPLADVLACIKQKTTLAEAGHLLSRHAEYVLRTPYEMRRLWSGYEEAFIVADQLADSCDFSLSELSYEYPDEILTKGRSAIDELDFQTWRGAQQRYPDGVPEIVEGYLRKELMLVRKLSYAPFF